MFTYWKSCRIKIKLEFMYIFRSVYFKYRKQKLCKYCISNNYSVNKWENLCYYNHVNNFVLTIKLKERRLKTKAKPWYYVISTDIWHACIKTFVLASSCWIILIFTQKKLSKWWSFIEFFFTLKLRNTRIGILSFLG